MALSKEETSRRRMSVVFGTLAGLLMWLMIHFVTASTSNGQQLGADGQRHEYLLFIGDISGWPSYLRSFWPLDLLESCLSFIYMYNMLYRGLRSGQNDPRGFRGWALFAAGYFSFAGSLGSAIFAPWMGWLFGIEGFLLMGTALLVIAGGLLSIGLGLSSGLPWLGRKLAAMYRQLSIGFPSLSPWPHRLTAAAKQSPPARAALSFGRYLNAEDRPDDPE